MRKNNVLVCHKNADEIDEIAYQKDVLVCHGNADQGIWTCVFVDHSLAFPQESIPSWCH